jgi:hypothetical protein
MSELNNRKREGSLVEVLVAHSHCLPYFHIMGGALPRADKNILTYGSAIGLHSGLRVLHFDELVPHRCPWEGNV